LVFLNQRGAEFSFSTPSAPPRPIHSNLSGVDPEAGCPRFRCSVPGSWVPVPVRIACTKIPHKKKRAGPWHRPSHS